MSFWVFCKPFWHNQIGRGWISAICLALMLAWQAPAPALAQDAACGDYAVAVAPQQEAHPLSDNSVQLIDATGAVASVAVDQPQMVQPSPRPGTAIVRSLGGIYSLLDVASATVRPIDIPVDEQAKINPHASLIRNAPVSDFMLLANYPATVWLVDLEGGDAIELSSLLPAKTFIESAAISPDGKTLLMFSQNAGYVMPLAPVGKPEPLDADRILPYPGFSAGGTAIVYATPNDDGSATIRSLELSSGIRTNIGTAPDAVAFDSSHGGLILTLDARTLRVLHPGSSTVTPIFTWAGAIDGLLSDSTGRYLLIGDEVEDRTHWYQVDAQTGASQELTELESMIPLSNGSTQDGLLFLQSAQQGTGTPGTPYRTLDLETGTVATPLSQDSTEVWTASLAGDSTGRYALVNAVSPGQGRMWLIDTQQGTASLIGSSNGNVSARVSPDGCQLALATFYTEGEGRVSAVTVDSPIDGATVVIEPDSILLGWASVNATGDGTPVSDAAASETPVTAHSNAQFSGLDSMTSRPNSAASLSAISARMRTISATA